VTEIDRSDPEPDSPAGTSVSETRSSGVAGYEQLLSLTRRRRSTRAIDPNRRVSDEIVEKVLEVARWAPSAGNAQPWEFLVLRDAEMRKRIAALYVKQMAEKREMQEAVWGRRSHVGFTGFRNSPVFVVILGDPRVIDAYPVRTTLEKGDSHFISSLAQATVLLHLAVASLGLGSQWVSDVSSPYLGTMMKSWLGIPRHMKVYDMAGIGYPTVTPPVSYRRPLADIVHHERYDESKARNAEAVQQFLWGHSLLGGLRSTNGSEADVGDS
jgi:5,6-dimethylbenzimidazole synthase